MIKVNSFQFIFVIFFSLNINAQGLYPILSMPYSARSISLCSSGTTDSYYSISNNPSSINSQFNIIGLHSISLPLDISYNRIEAILPSKNKIIFIDIKNINYGQFYDDLENSTFTANETDIKFGLKKSFFNTFSGGLSIEYIYSSISDYISQGIVLSIGVRAETLDSQNGISASVENNGIIFDYYNKSFEKIDNIYRISGFHKLKYLPSQINVNMIYDSYNLSWGSISFESKVKSIFMLRSGIGSILLNRKQHFSNFDYSFGFGIIYEKYIIDFGVKNINDIGLISGISMHYIIP